MNREEMHKVLNDLLKKTETPQEVRFLMDINLDGQAGLLQEIYELRGQVQGYKNALDRIIDELVYNKLIKEKQ